MVLHRRDQALLDHIVTVSSKPYEQWRCLDGNWQFKLSSSAQYKSIDNYWRNGDDWYFTCEDSSDWRQYSLHNECRRVRWINVDNEWIARPIAFDHEDIEVIKYMGKISRHGIVLNPTFFIVYIGDSGVNDNIPASLERLGVSEEDWKNGAYRIYISRLDGIFFKWKILDEFL